jgi:DNA repair protein RadC
MRIRELPAHERPAQRLAALGPAALSDAELLALVSGQQDLAYWQASLCGGDGWATWSRSTCAPCCSTPRTGCSRSQPSTSAR